MTTRQQRLENSDDTLYDSLNKKQRDLLIREHAKIKPVGTALWQLRLAPYPLDADTAATVESNMDNHVIPWALFEWCAEDWAYISFFEHAVRHEMEFNKRSRAEAESMVPELESLQGFFLGIYPETLVREWAADFADERDDVMSTIRESLARDHPSFLGCFIRMPYLPLGDDWLNQIPLIENVWIDRRIVELCEACAHLHEEGFHRLPARDSHNAAWHRFFRSNTSWKSPIAANHEVFTTALDRVLPGVRGMKVRTKTMLGRAFVHIDDYAGWPHRRVPEKYLSIERREEGVVMRLWNQWVRQYSEDGAAELVGVTISTVENPFDFRHDQKILPYSNTEKLGDALGQRQQAIDQLYKAGLLITAKSPDGPQRSILQYKILKALEGRALNARMLARASKCDETTLFRRGGVKELREEGVVIHDGKCGGYYRPDRPPQLEKTCQ